MTTFKHAVPGPAPVAYCNECEQPVDNGRSHASLNECLCAAIKRIDRAIESIERQAMLLGSIMRELDRLKTGRRAFE